MWRKATLWGKGLGSLTGQTAKLGIIAGEERVPMGNGKFVGVFVGFVARHIDGGA
jgi:hypothetical protein